jgi:RNA polymerase sigma factor (sigma-70 family)
MRIDAINNFLNNPNANKIRLNGRYHRLPEIYFFDSFIHSTEFVNETPFPAPDEHAEAASLSAEIEQVVSRFPKREQFIIQSFYFAGKSMQEIAEILGLGLNWTIQLRRRALWKMRREITNAFSGGDE